MRPSRRLLTALLACTLLAACSGDSGIPTTTAPPATTTTGPTSTAATTTSPSTTTAAGTTTSTTTTLPEGEPGAIPGALPSKAAFAGFRDIPLLDGTAMRIPDQPTSLDDVYWEFKVTDPEYPRPRTLRQDLARDGFAIDESWSSQVLHTVYSYTARYADGPVYVTTDAGYHEWHLVFSKALRDTEERVLLPLLEGLVTGLLGAAAEVETLDPEWTAAFDDVRQYLQAVGAVLELPVGEMGGPATAEVALVELHAGFDTSPTLGVEVDYSLLTPRGHYTRSEALTRYFKAMALLGVTPFPLDEPAAMRRAYAMSWLITRDAALADAWQRIYEATSFLVGAADDYTPVEFMAAVEATGAGRDDAGMAAVAAALRAARPVRIDAEKASVRTMGARFVIDSFLLDQLVHPQVWERLEASVLDVAAAMGSDWALAQQEAAGVPAQFPEYTVRLAALRDLVAERPAADWGGTVYDAWLYAILPMWLPRGEEFPGYMRTEAWAARSHQGGFGSYTELKHDTVLYTKQAFAEGDAPLPPEPPRHWVEPDPVPFERLAEAARLLREGLDRRDLLAEDTGALLDDLIAMEARFGRIARDELAGRPISAADNDWLAEVGSVFEVVWLTAGEGSADSLGGFAEDPESRAPVVVDIFSNPWDALEIATGGFDTLYVLAPNDNGHFQVAIGAVYAFYEFWVPRGERLTDEEWRQMLMDRAAPDRPEWLAFLYD